MRILDLFCGAGGAAMGYHKAFPSAEIVGIDINPQPNYPFTFRQADLSTAREWDDEQWDLIHASPPCQRFSTLNAVNDNEYDNLLDVVRDILFTLDVPWVIENVPGAEKKSDMNPNLALCGSMFNLRYGGFELRRHRLFETSFVVPQPPHAHELPVLGVYGDLARFRRPSNRGVKAGFYDAQRLMRIEWMTKREIVQAIPPAYTEFIGFWLDEIHL